MRTGPSIQLLSERTQDYQRSNTKKTKDIREGTYHCGLGEKRGENTKKHLENQNLTTDPISGTTICAILQGS